MEENCCDYSFEHENSRRWYHKAITAVEAGLTLPLVAIYRLTDLGKGVINKIKQSKLEKNIGSGGAY